MTDALTLGVGTLVKKATTVVKLVDKGVDAAKNANKINDSKKLVEKTNNGVAKTKKELLKEGRSGKQERLKDIAKDTKESSANRGWVKQEINNIAKGKQKNIRNPPGKVLAHERGREAAKGYSYKYSNLQNKDLHKLQHKYDKNGKLNKERPIK